MGMGPERWFSERLMPFKDSSRAMVGGIRPQTLLEDNVTSSTLPSFDRMP